MWITTPEFSLATSLIIILAMAMMLVHAAVKHFNP